MNNPAVSICCITYNHAKYIHDALEGFLMQQTNFSFEILIHDDASTDGTADIIREYEAKYPDIIKPIYQKENQYSKGKSIWCEYQFPCAKGKYIALCEGDDFWTDSHKLQIQYDFMESHPDYSMCFHNANIVIEDKKTSSGEELFTSLEEREYTGNEIFNSWILPTASAFFRTEFWTDIPCNKDFWCGDIIVWLTMARQGRIFAQNRIMASYRKTASGAMCRMSEVEFKKRYQLYHRHLIAIQNEFSDVLSKGVLIRQFYLLDFSHMVSLAKNSFAEALHFWLTLPVMEKIDLMKRSFVMMCSIAKAKFLK